MSDKPFKKLDVKRKGLLAMPGNALKVWFAYWMQEGEERLGWLSEETICTYTNLNPKTMRHWRKWLIENGWLQKMGYRKSNSGEFAVPRFRVKEGSLPETKPCPTDRIQNLVARAVQDLDNRPAPSFGAHRVQDLEEEVEPLKYNPSEVEPVSDLVSKSVSAAEPDQANLDPLSYESLTILRALYPKTVPDGLAFSRVDLNTVAEAMTAEEWSAFFLWNRTHKPGNLVFRSVEKFLAGVGYALNDYANHEPEFCPMCRKKTKGTNA